MNFLLAALPEAERQRLEPLLELVSLDLREVMIEPGEPIRYVYFPLNLVASVVHTMSNGSTVETGIVGRDGLVGIQVWLGRPETTTRTFVQVPGQTLRMRSDVFTAEVVKRDSPLNELIAAYVHAFLLLTTVTSACNRIHRVEQRLCRWLKMVHNRVPGEQFPVRHEFLAYMLGVHRPSVSIAANVLKKAGLIAYDYGRLRVKDPRGLEAGACECYTVMENQIELLYGQPLRK